MTLTDADFAIEAYRQLRNLPLDWQPDWGSTEWNWFKIGWDARWIRASAYTPPAVVGRASRGEESPPAQAAG